MALSNETPASFVQQYFKPPLAISLHLRRDCHDQEGNVCFAVSWLTQVPGFINLLHSTSVLKDVCVTWIPFQSHTGSSYVSPIKLSSPAFIPAKEVQAEIRSHSS